MYSVDSSMLGTMGRCTLEQSALNATATKMHKQIRGQITIVANGG